MCLWNTDALGEKKVKIWRTLLSPTFWPWPSPGEVSEVWTRLKNLLLKFGYCITTKTLNIANNVLKWDGLQTDRRENIYRQTSRTIQTLYAPADRSGRSIIIFFFSFSKKNYKINSPSIICSQVGYGYIACHYLFRTSMKTQYFTIHIATVTPFPNLLGNAIQFSCEIV